MKKQGFDRRDFLKSAVVGGAAAAGGTAAIPLEPVIGRRVAPTRWRTMTDRFTFPNSQDPRRPESRQ